MRYPAAGGWPIRRPSANCGTTCRGDWLQAKGNEALSFDHGRFDAINLRDASDHQRMAPVQGGARNVSVRGTPDSNAFDFAGASYRFSDNTRACYNMSF